MACAWSWPMPACSRPSRSSRFPTHAALGGVVLLGAAAVGLATGLGAWLMTQAVYRFEDAFHLLTGRVHWMWWPMIGGLIIGLGGLVEPRALGVGYGTIHAELLGQLGLSALALLFVVKLLIWSAGLGSGTSGGILAPVLMLGAAIGGILGHALPGTTPGVWALIGLAGAMGGVTRSPFTAIIFAFELTHDQNSLLGALGGGHDLASGQRAHPQTFDPDREGGAARVPRHARVLGRSPGGDLRPGGDGHRRGHRDAGTGGGEDLRRPARGISWAPAAALSRARRGHRARRAPALVGHPRGTGPFRPLRGGGHAVSRGPGPPRRGPAHRGRPHGAARTRGAAGGGAGRRRPAGRPGHAVRPPAGPPEAPGGGAPRRTRPDAAPRHAEAVASDPAEPEET